MEKILSIKQVAQGTWIKTEDNRWHNINILSNGETYINGSFVCNDINSIGYKSWDKKQEKIISRFEILDL